jgi:hypothetical protein
MVSNELTAKDMITIYDNKALFFNNDISNVADRQYPVFS